MPCRLRIWARRSAGVRLSLVLGRREPLSVFADRERKRPPELRASIRRVPLSSPTGCARSPPDPCYVLRMQNRLTDLASIEKSVIDPILDAADDVIVQFSKPVYSRGLLRRINSLCALHGERVVVRFFGHYSDCFDFACLRDLPAVKALVVDCLQDALNVDVLWTLQNLTR